MKGLRRMKGEWVKKKVKDLIPGDIVKDRGFIVKINLKDDFWNGKPTMTCYDLNDSYYGPGTGEITKDEYEVLENRHDLIDAHNIVDSDLAKHIADLMEYRREYRKIHGEFFTAYNKSNPRKTNKSYFHEDNKDEEKDAKDV